MILTGSQASIFALQSDAVDNLLGSLIIAGTFVIPEVCLFFHHRLLRGNRATKVSASAFDAFASPNCGALATVTGLGVDVDWQLVRRPTRLARFDVRTTHLDTAHVACVRVFPGIKPEMLDSVLRVPNLRGLIIETFGMGNVPSSPAPSAPPSPGGSGSPSLLSVIRSAVERGITVVNISQCVHGIVSPLYAPGFALGEAGVVFGHDLTSEAALTKLSYLLASADLDISPGGGNPNPSPDPKTVAARMARSLRGEMTELVVPSFTHPSLRSSSFSLAAAAAAAAAVAVDDDDDDDGAAAQGKSLSSLISPADAAFTALGWAIRGGDVAAVRELLEGDGDDKEEAGHHQRRRRRHNYRLLERADYAGNTALHLAAVAGRDRQQDEGMVHHHHHHPTTTTTATTATTTTATETRRDHVAVLRELLVRGASVHARNRANNTPLFLARRAGDAECVALLEAAGAALWGDEKDAGASGGGGAAVSSGE